MNQIQKGHVEAGGVRYGYEIRGAGAPLLLLHGGFGTMEMFAPVLGSLTARRQVIAVDLYGHGRTALTERSIDAIAMGDDIATLVPPWGSSGWTSWAFRSAEWSPSAWRSSTPRW
jgi:pimeloyl-ACP methyl ester carboxylesterase